MLTRTFRTRGTCRTLPTIVRDSRSYAYWKAEKHPSVNETPANDPNTRTAPQNVSGTNELATSSEGSFDKVLQESVEKAEQLRTMQAPNRKGIWSRSQQPREAAMTGPRFEQTIMEDQVRENLYGRAKTALKSSGSTSPRRRRNMER